jgi:hypothetical protein
LILPRYFFGEELIDKYELKPGQLIDLVERGLIPHDSNILKPYRVKTKDQAWLEYYLNELFLFLLVFKKIKAKDDNDKKEQYEKILKSHPRLRDHVNRNIYFYENSPLWPIDKNSVEKLIDICKKEIKKLKNKGTKLPSEWKTFNWAYGIILYPFELPDLHPSYLETSKRLSSAVYRQDQLLSIIEDISPEKECANYAQCKKQILNSELFLAPYLDERNPKYSIELWLAIRCWEALFGENGAYKEGKKTPRNQIEEWLREEIKQRRLNVGNRSQISKEAINRIATLINPSPKGGAPKSNA